MFKTNVKLVLHRYRHGRREREAVEIHNKSGSGSPRPKRRSPRLAAAGGAGGSGRYSPAASWASPAGSTSTMDGSLFASPMSSPGLEEALKKGRGSTRKPGVGSVTTRRPLHDQRSAPPECAGVGANDGVTNICLIAVAVVGIVLGLYVILPYFKGAADPVLKSEALSKSRRQIILENLGSEFQELRRKFPRQDRRLWSVVAAATKRVVQDEYPVQPAVLMLVSPPGGSHADGSDVTDCLATHITDAIRRAHNNSKALKLNLHDFVTSSGKGPDVLKLELDDVLSSSFTSGNKAGLLYNIQDLPSRTAMLFHSYCDNENAPFKDITITFTVKLDASTQQAYTSDEEIEGYFYKLWSDLDRDTLSPLLSRVANSIALVRREDEQVMEQHCK